MKDFTLRLAIDLYNAVKAMGKDQKRDITNQIRFLLEEAVEKHEDEKGAKK